MHIPDGFTSCPINVACGALATAAVTYAAVKTVRESRGNPRLVPMMAASASFIFAAQMLNFPIGGGTSGHFLGAALATALLGPWAACLTMTAVLTLQCLLFADGGLAALGVNIVNMGLIAILGAHPLLRVLRGKTGVRHLLGIGACAWLSVVLASAACAVELAASGAASLGSLLPAMVGTHAIIGIGEAVITVGVLILVEKRMTAENPEPASVISRRRNWRLAGGGLGLALILSIFISPFASGDPDGLEKVAGNQGFISTADGAALWQWSPLPDYTVPVIGENFASTALAGLLGTIGAFALVIGAGKLPATVSQANHRN